MVVGQLSKLGLSHVSPSAAPPRSKAHNQLFQIAGNRSQTPFQHFCSCFSLFGLVSSQNMVFCHPDGKGGGGGVGVAMLIEHNSRLCCVHPFLALVLLARLLVMMMDGIVMVMTMIASHIRA